MVEWVTGAVLVALVMYCVWLIATLPLCTGVVRMVLSHRFPYGIFFFLEGEDSVVVAVHHLHGEPHSWTHRL